MSQNDPAPVDPHQDTSLAAAEAQNKQIMNAFGKLLESITPWLLEFGSWLFGGLIAFILIVIASLFTIGPVDPAILVATAAFAFALPLNITGLFLLRVFQDLKNVKFEEEAVQAFHDAGFTIGEQLASPKTLESLRKRRTAIFLSWSLPMMTLTASFPSCLQLEGLW